MWYILRNILYCILENPKVQLYLFNNTKLNENMLTYNTNIIIHWNLCDQLFMLLSWWLFTRYPSEISVHQTVNPTGSLTWPHSFCSPRILNTVTYQTYLIRKIYPLYFVNNNWWTCRGKCSWCPTQRWSMVNLAQIFRIQNIFNTECQMSSYYGTYTPCTWYISNNTNKVSFWEDII